MLKTERALPAGVTSPGSSKTLRGWVLLTPAGPSSSASCWSRKTCWRSRRGWAQAEFASDTVCKGSALKYPPLWHFCPDQIQPPWPGVHPQPTLTRSAGNICFASPRICHTPPVQALQSQAACRAQRLQQCCLRPGSAPGPPACHRGFKQTILENASSCLH